MRLGKKRNSLVWVLAAAFVLLNPCAFARAEGFCCLTKKKNVSDIDKFRKFVLRSQYHISPKEKSGIDFAIGEYYFKVNDFYDAKRAFQDYVSQNPEGISTLIANVYLCKIAKSRNDQKLSTAVKKEIFKNKFVLLFDKYKTLKYTSVYPNEYEVRYFVDKIEVFLNGDPFEQISP